MQYKIEISGGLAGFLDEFEGELLLDKAARKDLAACFDKVITKDLNSQIRDGFVYSFELEINDRFYSASYTDFSIPQTLRELLDKVKKKHKGR